MAGEKNWDDFRSLAIEQLPALLTIEETAQWLRVNRATLSRWIRSGKIECCRYPGGTRKVIKREHLKAFIDNQIAGKAA
jgi:excisionase family DNA binding protein